MKKKTFKYSYLHTFSDLFLSSQTPLEHPRAINYPNETGISA